MRQRVLSFVLFFALASAARADDWPRFLGPFGTSVSTEKGILSPWPKEGLKIVWHKEVGIGYCMPAISKGNLYQFDRKGKLARLTCMDAKTSEEHWTFEYPSV